MRRVLNPHLYVAPSAVEGRGCYIDRPVARWRKVGELAGERVSAREARRRMRGRRRIRICDVDERTAIDAGKGGDATAFINHSCDPNLFMRVQHGHVLFFARRPLEAGTELSVDYGESHHGGTRRCRCGAATCRQWI